MAHQSITRFSAIAALGTTITLGACSDSAGLGRNASAQLAFSTSGVTASRAAAASVPVTAGGHTLDLAGVSLTISRAELKRAQTDACHGDDDDTLMASGTAGAMATTSNGNGNDHGNDDNSCAEVKVGATTIDLPLTGGVVTIPANTIPAGTFRELELRVSQVELKGTFDGQAFDVTLPVNLRDEIEFSTPLVVAEGTATSITVNVPVNTWLTNSDGSLVDPSKLLGNPALSAAVRNRIAASFRAFEDRNHDGHDDHDGGEGHGHDGD
jgi:hypothetical protein